jgi:hypothetical protein
MLLLLQLLQGMLLLLVIGARAAVFVVRVLCRNLLQGYVVCHHRPTAAPLGHQSCQGALLLLLLLLLLHPACAF